MKKLKVYSKCAGRKEIYLEQNFEGSRYECEKYINTLHKNNRPTHFYFISSLEIEKASKRYL